MRPRQFAKYLARDLHCPCGCVGKEDTYVPQHRAGRGMGGSKTLDRPSNIIVLCSLVNGAIEYDPEWAARARDFGWKLSRWQKPEESPFFDRTDATWHVIDDEFNRRPYGAVIA